MPLKCPEPYRVPGGHLWVPLSKLALGATTSWGVLLDVPTVMPSTGLGKRVCRVERWEYSNLGVPPTSPLWEPLRWHVPPKPLLAPVWGELRWDG